MKDLVKNHESQRPRTLMLEDRSPGMLNLSLWRARWDPGAPWNCLQFGGWRLNVCIFLDMCILLVQSIHELLKAVPTQRSWNHRVSQTLSFYRWENWSLRNGNFPRTTWLVGAYVLLYTYHWPGHCPKDFMCSPSLRLHHNPNDAATVMTPRVQMSTLGPEELSNLAGMMPHL